MAGGFKPTTARQRNSGGAQKDKAGMGFVIPEEVKENRSVVMAKSPQSEAVARFHKNEDGIMPPNKAGHSKWFHCGSKRHWARDCDQLSKTRRQSL